MPHSTKPVGSRIAEAACGALTGGLELDRRSIDDGRAGQP
jgi:hypothetical protein